MNIKDLHTKLKPVSAIPHFKAEEGNVTAIQILNNQLLILLVVTISKPTCFATSI